MEARSVLPDDPDMLYDVARRELALCLALASKGSDGSESPSAGRPDYASHALESLALAIGNGFKDFDRLKHDPDLASIRSHKDFLVLLMDLEFPDDPFAR